MVAYLDKHGPMNPAEYSKRKDTPARLQVIRKCFRSWSEMLRYVERKKKLATTTGVTNGKDAKII